MSKEIAIEEAISHIKDGDTIMVGGFMTNGSPEKLIDALVEKGLKDLTLICNDAGFPDKGVGKMIAKKQFSKIIASHIGLNREAGRQMTEGETIIDLVLQGTLAEKIRSGAFGLGGFLTPTGIGTLVAEGKDIIRISDKDFLLEEPLKADIALIFASKADKMGNLQYRGSENNFNHVMAANAKTTIVEAAEIVEIGQIDPIAVHTPGIFVNHIVKGA